MITVTNTYGVELDNITTYCMTIDKDIKSIKDLPDGSEIEVDKLLDFIDEKEDGTAVELFSIMATDGAVYATNSKTFREDVINISKVFEGSDVKPTIIKMSDTSRSGRTFNYAVLKKN